MKPGMHGGDADAKVNDGGAGDSLMLQDGQQMLSSQETLRGCSTPSVCEKKIDAWAEIQALPKLEEKDRAACSTKTSFSSPPLNPDREKLPIPDDSDIGRRVSSASLSRRLSGRDGADLPQMTRISIDPEGNTYPEGGAEAYLVVFGCFCALFGSLGLINSIGSFQAWLATNQLKDYSQGSISWIWAVNAFLLCFCGLQVGPIFDAKGPRVLVLIGSILIVTSLTIFGFAQHYWHFMLSMGVLCGLGACFVFTPAVANPGHFFLRLRGRATGLAATGGSAGGVVFPLMLEQLLPRVGFAWATRAVALISLVTLGTSCLLVKSRLPKKKATKENILPDLRILREPVFALTATGIFFVEFGLFIPLTYITSYALAHNMSHKISYQILAILNAGSFFGRWLPGYIADYMGRFNTMIIAVLVCLLSNLLLWLLAGDSVVMLVLYASVFGFGSGSNISLTPVCVGQVCKTEHYGRYYATAYTLVSFGMSYLAEEP
ncbi:hypothetical protein AJ80_08599 [Polytolypa hystricis UAMH7299]|uniref:Major facilitator superfamily (MFS) profile domain-containing protein n=1 Tax=Polytolypa hystricis (strain UAMH7299) TaxID=1447883 RepID=A0A2B7X4Z1_POLH7|nr:hypothetical protein AJ80_08599 [Polytolypa hystricis UAMH7299]